MTEQTASLLSADEIRAISHDEPAWLQERRREALAEFQAAAPPDRAAHLWRYSDPGDFEPAGGVEAAPARPELSEEARRAGVSLLPLGAAAAHAEHGPRVQEHLGRLIGPDFGRLEAFNAAAWETGLYLHVPRKVRLEEPVALPLGGGRVRRILAVVDEGADVTLLEEHTGGGEDVVHGVSEIFAGQAARVELVVFQHLDPEAHAHLSQRIHLERDARALSALVSFGGHKTKIDTGTLLLSLIHI